MLQKICNIIINSKVIRFLKNLKIASKRIDIEILVPVISTFQSVRISISVPKMNQITQSNKANPLKCIEKITMCLESVQLVNILLSARQNTKKRRVKQKKKHKCNST
jgi:hypothetical protein